MRVAWVLATASSAVSEDALAIARIAAPGLQFCTDFSQVPARESNGRNLAKCHAKGAEQPRGVGGAPENAPAAPGRTRGPKKHAARAGAAQGGPSAHHQRHGQFSGTRFLDTASRGTPTLLRQGRTEVDWGAASNRGTKRHLEWSPCRWDPVL